MNIENFKIYLLDVVVRWVGDPHATLLVGMIFGFEARLSDQVQQLIKITGTQHLLSASGSNVTFFAGSAGRVVQSWSSKQLLGCVLLVVGTLYSCLVGANPPIIRAIFTLWISVVSLYFLKRSYHRLYGLILVFF